MKKLLLIALFSQIIIACGKNTRHTTNEKNVRLDSFENMRYNILEEVKNDSLKIVKAI